MRDINRIEPFLKEFGEIWKKEFPDWRFGQIVSNLQRCVGNDLYFYEDDELLKKMKLAFGLNEK